MGHLLALAAPVVVILAVVSRTLLFLLPRISIPPHLANHNLVIEPKLISDGAARDILSMMEQMAEFPSNIAADLKTGGFKALHEHIGEGLPPASDGSCPHSLLVPNQDKTLCILPQRIDVGKHFIMTGGPDGAKEDYESMIDRVSSFGRYIFVKDLDSYPVIKSLFESEPFQQAALKICPATRPFLDPFQFNLIVQVPGQTVALHLDAPYFWGASRFQMPQWLLVAMVYSNLFTERFVDQVQVVGYLHQWTPQTDAGGQFIYYTNDTFTGYVSPTSQSGIIVDGSKTVHAALIYHPTVRAPHLDKDKDSLLKFAGGDNWDLIMDNNKIGQYKTRDLRISIVYRARCFESAEKAAQFSSLPSSEYLQLDDVLNTLQDDMIARKVLKAEQKNAISRLDLALLIMDTYIKYPLPAAEKALFPYNYCAASRLFPAVKPLLSLICK